MTKRARYEKRAQLRQEWAEKRRKAAAALDEQNAPFRGDLAFNSQPGHIPAREKANRRSERAYEHRLMAAHHDRCAKEIGRQLDASVYSDDVDAVERLRARVADREAERMRAKAYNASCRRGARDLSVLDKAQKKRLLASARAGQLTAYGAFPGYYLRNLGAQIRRDKKRIEMVGGVEDHDE